MHSNKSDKNRTDFQSVSLGSGFQVLFILEAMESSGAKKKNQRRNMAGKKRQFSQKGKNFGKNKKGNRSIGHKKESKIDREIREITQLQKQIEELSALPEEEKANIKKFEALPLSNYTKKGLNEAGFTEMTDIQQKSLISALMGFSLLYNCITF